ncbi:hypothetical protein QP027_02020 [Corynebacterium breve]|uniref:Uncharacterized protein n=1 Tax=Corynebacterium breve TaxID=3049799 RepID=A0ABY8VHG3_9CORY|nr:hypothetical protein [Corynebacterium breve]WIM68200.1 hypothetical protein QP027_02020 [Corynebacterium breve]
MKLFTSPVHPALPWAIFLLAAIVAAVGREWTFDGQSWTVGAGLVLATTMAYFASRWPALDQLGAKFSAWLAGALSTGVGGAAIMALFITPMTIWNSLRNPWYNRFDALLVTSGDAPFFDTNGEPYLVPNAGQNPTTMALTALIIFLFLATAALVGLAIGLATTVTTKVIIVGAAIVAGFATVVWSSAPSFYNMWQKPVAIAIGCGVSLLACAWVFTRQRKQASYS